MIILLTSIHVVVSIFLILVVLLQQGKGADLSVFGGGSTQSAFGARGAATVLHKLTVIGFVLFIFTTIGISLMQASTDRGSVMSEETATGVEALPPAADMAAETITPDTLEGDAPPAGEAATPDPGAGGDGQ